MSRPSQLAGLSTSLALAGLLLTSSAMAQSTAASQVSAISMDASAESAAVVIEALPAGSKLVVTALRPVGDMVELSAETAGHASRVVLRVSAATVRTTGMVVGDTLAITAMSAGLLIYMGGEAIAFIPDQVARSLTHHRKL